MNIDNLMRESVADDYGIRELQNIILNIARDVDDFCQHHGITYRLMGGSALGAKRHGGFIPWDDDLDIFMTPDEYEKFRELFHKHGDKEKYYLHELGASDGMVTTAKVRLNNSYYEEEIIKNWKLHHGIYIDIFILHTCPNNTILRMWQYVWAKYIIVKGLANKQYKRRGKIVYFMLLLMKVLPKRFLLNFALKQIYAFRNTKSNYFCNYLGKALYKNGTYNYSHFSGVKRVPFETLNLYVAKDLEEFLKSRFGDYMQIPSSERIRYEQHASHWNLGKRTYDNLSDEKILF